MNMFEKLWLGVRIQFLMLVDMFKQPDLDFKDEDYDVPVCGKCGCLVDELCREPCELEGCPIVAVDRSKEST